MAKRNVKKFVDPVGTVLAVNYHRNGVSGEGFYVVMFIGAKDSDVAGAQFVATVFREEGHVAVLRINDLMAGDIKQAWRGDHFAAGLRRAIRRNTAREDKEREKRYAEREES